MLQVRNLVLHSNSDRLVRAVPPLDRTGNGNGFLRFGKC